MAISAKTTLAGALTALALAAPAHAAEIVEQPASVERGAAMRIAWTGGPAEVVVERRHGLSWVTDASAVSSEQDARRHCGPHAGSPRISTPLGTYRIARSTESPRRSSTSGRAGASSRTGCARRWRDGRFLLTLTAEYAPPRPGSFHSASDAVTTGRPVVRVMRDGRRIGSVRLRYSGGKFRGSWNASMGAAALAGLPARVADRRLQEPLDAAL